jgi:hypothetical protein
MAGDAKRSGAGSAGIQPIADCAGDAGIVRTQQQRTQRLLSSLRLRVKKSFRLLDSHGGEGGNLGRNLSLRLYANNFETRQPAGASAA